jgi:hypothetical protein
MLHPKMRPNRWELTETPTIDTWHETHALSHLYRCVRSSDVREISLKPWPVWWCTYPGWFPSTVQDQGRRCLRVATTDLVKKPHLVLGPPHATWLNPRNPLQRLPIIPDRLSQRLYGVVAETIQKLEVSDIVGRLSPVHGTGGLRLSFLWEHVIKGLEPIGLFPPLYLNVVEGV